MRDDETKLSPAARLEREMHAFVAGNRPGGAQQMLRKAILFLADQNSVHDLAMHQPLARRFALRFVAGESLDEAIEVVRKLNARGLRASLDHLGENVTSVSRAREAAEEYLAILDRIAAAGVDCNISVKLTQMGLDQGPIVAQDNLRLLVARAADLKTFVRVDMEGSAYTQRTLDIVRAVHEEFGDHVGPVIQAYLYRSASDIQDLIARRIRTRLCKGAYNEPSSVAYPRTRDVELNYMRLAQQLLQWGNYPALATHDEKIIRWAQRYAKNNGIGAERFEFQMLYGIRRDLQDELVKSGYNVRVYVPYGTEWYPYLMRRLAERPANLVFALSNALRR